MNRYFLPFLIATILLSACIPSVDETASGVSDQTTGERTVISSNLPPENMRTPMIAVMPTSTIKVDVDTTASETSTELVVNATINHRICNMPPQQFDLLTDLGINRITDLRFEDEMLLTFEGWADRPDPSLMPLTPEPTPSMMPEPYPSARILLVAGQVSINENRIEPRIVDFVPVLNNPCGETCPLEIISQSPDEQ